MGRILLEGNRYRDGMPLLLRNMLIMLATLAGAALLCVLLRLMD